jgi:type IV pilus assembly protein PilO
MIKLITVDELKKLNPKNPGSWPWLIKGAVFLIMFLLVIVAGALLDWQGEFESLQRIKGEEDSLKQVYLDKKKEAINLDLIRKQLAETQESFGALLKQLPSKSEMDALLTDISQAGLGRGLQFELFVPGGEVTRDNTFVEQPISIKVNGNYDDLAKFSSDIALLSRIVTINNISVTPTATALTMDATAKTFRYLEDTEISAQNKAAAKPAAPAAPAPATPPGAKK